MNNKMMNKSANRAMGEPNPYKLQQFQYFSNGSDGSKASLIQDEIYQNEDTHRQVEQPVVSGQMQIQSIPSQSDLNQQTPQNE